VDRVTAIGMFDTNGESYHRGRFLVDRYRERDSPTWSELEASAEQTTRVVRNTVESLVDHRDRIGDEELKTLYHPNGTRMGHDMCCLMIPPGNHSDSTNNSGRKISTPMAIYTG